MITSRFAISTFSARCLRSIIVLLNALTLLICTTGQVAAQTKVTYFHNDLSGNPVAASDSTGQVIWRESFRPYGERLKNAAASQTNSQWYTGHRQDADTGLVYMGARHYDPLIGRFLSIDPAGLSESDPHSFNRYAYANNNPMKFTDPDGNIAKLIVAAAKLAIKGGDVYSTVSGIVENTQTIFDPNASGFDKGLAALDIAADLVTGFNSRDVKAGVKAIEGAASPAPLKRLHSDETYKMPGEAKSALESQQKRSTEDIINSLKPGSKEPLTVKSNGTVMDGNTRVKVLEDRGVNVNELPRTIY